MMRAHGSIAGAAFFLGLLATPALGGPAEVVASLAPALDCSSLAGERFDRTSISLARLNAATAELPEHCEVVGAIDARVGPVDQQPYAIRFHLRMPTEWNGRFFYSGGGGTDGNLGNADAPQIAQGYAVVTTDSGHDNLVNTSVVAGSNQFGFDPRARSDYGYSGPALTAQTAKAIIARYFGRGPRRSYFMGCSEGGREGLMFSQRYPDVFDGIVAGNPGMDLPRAAVAQAWDSQAFARAAQATTPFGNPDLASSFSDQELAAVGQAILDRCDALDGLIDGMVFAPQDCRFEPASLGPEGSGVLSQTQVTALEQVFDGARNSAGARLYSGWYWDPGVAAFGWRQWKIGPVAPGFPIPGNSAINVTLGGGAIPFIFTTPPNAPTHGTDLAASTTVAVANPLGQPGTTGFGDAFVPYILGYDMDRDAPRIFVRTPRYRESSMEFMFTSGVSYREFRRRGSKLIVYTGQADPVFSAKYHVGWYHRLIAFNGGLERTRSFARVFLVPGMNHCGGGPSTSQFDAFSAVVDWVERGRAPDHLIGTAPAGTPWPGRTRPLCAYPRRAEYSGQGDTERADSFRCR